MSCLYSVLKSKIGHQFGSLVFTDVLFMFGIIVLYWMNPVTLPPKPFFAENLVRTSRVSPLGSLLKRVSICS